MTMKLVTIALAAVFALSSTFALAAHRHHHRGHHMSSHAGSNGPNGSAGGRTSLSGTGNSSFGGSVAGTSGKN